MELNKVHTMKFEEGAFLLPKGCVKLLILDPPYFRVKGEFDFIWASFEDYLEDVRKWARAADHLLAENGSLFVYGHAKKIAYVQVIFDEYFNLENSMVWRKTECQTMAQDFDRARCFAPVTERILFYSREVESSDLDKLKNNPENFKPLRTYFGYIQAKLDMSKNQIIKRIGQGADHCFRWQSAQWDLPTPETYDKLVEAYQIDLIDGFKHYAELRQEYDELRTQYETNRRYFNNENKLYDVLDFSQESHITGKYDHDTIKPETLTRALILATSKMGDLIGVGFAGSGTECAMAARENRPFIGFEINEQHAEDANKRAEEFTKNRQTSILDFV